MPFSPSGRSITTLVGTPIADLPKWISAWGKLGLVKVEDINLDGILQLAELSINPDVIVLATPEVAGLLPYFVSGLIAAGGLAAALSTADGLLLTMCSALSHDVYFHMINPAATTQRRLLVSKATLMVVAMLAAWVASLRPDSIPLHRRFRVLDCRLRNIPGDGHRHILAESQQMGRCDRDAGGPGCSRFLRAAHASVCGRFHGPRLVRHSAHLLRHLRRRSWFCRIGAGQPRHRAARLGSHGAGPMICAGPKRCDGRCKQPAAMGVSRNRHSAAILPPLSGEVDERFKSHAWKACLG